jgi:hypothetical protein
MTGRRLRLFSLIALVAIAAAGCQNDAAIEQDDLPEIVLGPDEGLPGLEYDASLSGPADEYLAREFGTEWPPDGYESSYQRYFQGPPPSDPEAFPVKNLRGLVSVAMLFQSSEGAREYLTTTYPPVWRLDVAGFDTLGEERRGLVTETTGGLLADPAARPRRTTVIWRRGNVFLQLNVLGEFPLEDVIPLAKVVDARAAARFVS